MKTCYRCCEHCAPGHEPAEGTFCDRVVRDYGGHSDPCAAPACALGAVVIE